MTDSFYYLNSDRQPVGPMDLGSIRRLVTAEVIDSNVLICEAGKEEWIPLAHLEESSSEEGAVKNVGPPHVPPPPRTTRDSALSWTELISPPYPEWLPLVSIATGILSLLLFSLPLIAFLLAAAALATGILILRQTTSQGRGFALTGTITGALGLFALLLGMFFGGGSEVAAIENTLTQGIQISHEAAKRYPGNAANQSRFISSELQKVDTRGGPPEFRVAYQRNVDAWETAVPYFEVNNAATWFLEGFFGGLANDYSAIGLSDYQARAAAQNIDETYRNLKTIAVAYGAKIPTP